VQINSVFINPLDLIEDTKRTSVTLYWQNLLMMVRWSDFLLLSKAGRQQYLEGDTKDFQTKINFPESDRTRLCCFYAEVT